MSVKKTSENKSKGKVVKCHCIECKRETNSEILYNYKFEGSDEIEPGFEVHWFDDYQVVRCLGCDYISFVKVSWFSEDCFESFEDGIKQTSYPNIQKKVPLEIKDIPDEILELYEEVTAAYNIEAYILVAGGLRAMIEAICSSKNIDRGQVPNDQGGTSCKKTLEGKIFGLRDAGYISTKQVEALHELRFLGNTALHEIDKPTEVQVRIAFSIIESIMEVIFGFEDKSKKLRVFRQRH